MNEALLYYIWQQKLYDTRHLATVDGEPLAVLHAGVRNTDAGPDFSQARIRVNGVQFAGNVEVHVRSSDWEKHGHASDKAYDSVILHVVYEHDLKNSNPALPVLELKNRVDEKFLSRYRQLMAQARWIPCETHIGRVEQFHIGSGLHRLLVERMEEKTAFVSGRLRQNKNNWEETFYQITARNFGLKINADVFEQVALSLPLPVVARHKKSLLQVEALVFGQAGMLQTDFKDEYPRLLKNEYAFLRKKYRLKPVDAHLWKFMRLRPAAFPTVRLAQFAMLLFRSSHLFSKVQEAPDANAVTTLFAVTPSAYWDSRYRFDAPSPLKEKSPGKDFIRGLIINAVAPVLFHFGRSKGNVALQEKAFSLLEEVPAEKNNILSKWKSLGVTARSAYDSQALLQLKNGYCSHKLCLQCFIGHKILKT